MLGSLFWRPSKTERGIAYSGGWAVNMRYFYFSRVSPLVFNSFLLFWAIYGI
jgi:hypothetical protein